MKRSTPMKRSLFRREGPSAERREHPLAKPSAKTCAHCGKPFVPSRSMQKVCSTIRCAQGYAKKLRIAKELAERERDRQRRQDLKTIANLIAEAQVEFNAFIRARDRHKGCFVCGRPFDPNIPGRAIHAGHVRSRGAAGHLRFNEDNCLGECEGCNGPHGAKPHQIKAGAIARIGQERYDALEASNEPRKWTREGLIALKLEYRAKRKALERGQS